MNFRSENKIKMEGGMSTMTDLVFLLLIFFIVISTMITAGVNIDVPQNGGAKSDKKILTIDINDNNEFLVNKEKTPVSSQEIKKVILKEIGKDSIISLYGSDKSSWEASVFIINIAKQNNFKISINGAKN